jgi:UDP-galactopyranose mutase
MQSEIKEHDLLCFCHLRWNFVYQRPQHLMERFAASRRVFFIEEPLFDTPQDCFEVLNQDSSNVQLIRFHLAPGKDELSVADRLRSLLDELLQKKKIETFTAWYYTPMALSFSRHLFPEFVVYDCMDELSAFKFASPELKAFEKELFLKADIVFTGGKTLFKSKRKLHPNVHAFPSSIDKAHFLSARENTVDPSDQAGIPHPRFGFYGVLDERFDANLVERIASLRPDWHLVLVGPVVKIDPATLPQKDNIHYLGGKTYRELPTYLAGWDIAFMPFALNESTHFISPTKTPEFLCGGKQTISTAVPDVVNDYGKKGLVAIIDSAEAFVDVAEKLLYSNNYKDWLARVDRNLATNSWDKTVQRMTLLMEQTKQVKQLQSTTKAKLSNYV